MKTNPILIPLLFIILTCCCKDPLDQETGKSTAVFNPSKTYGTLVDIDGNIYKTITIGDQTWMAENLRTTHYQNGDPIPNVKAEENPSVWGALTSGAYCTYNNTTNPDSIATFGFLYNGYAAIDNRNVAPLGWRVPTDEDWDKLQTFVASGDAITNLYGNSIAGERLKEAFALHWGASNNGDNSSGFTALPGGQRYTWYNEASWHSEFQFIGNTCYYWSSTSIYQGRLLIRIMTSDYSSITRGQYFNSYGISIRCVKDN